jgi:hypothetical protein
MLRLAVRLATAWEVQAYNAGGDEIFRARGHPACPRMGTGIVPGVKRPELGADHPPSSSTEVANAVELHIRLSAMLV